MTKEFQMTNAECRMKFRCSLRHSTFAICHSLVMRASSLEHFHQICRAVLRVPRDSGLFCFWLRFSSVTGFFKPAPSLKPRQKTKILAAHRYIFSVNALVIRVLTGAIRIYQLAISPAQTFFFGPTAGCRFTPTCSRYAIDAIRGRGAIVGSWLAAKRICRCHPFGGCGHDPVAEKAEGRRQKAEAGIVLENSL
jgi:putative membrane protein insertion efficiency factor